MRFFGYEIRFGAAVEPEVKANRTFFSCWEREAIDALLKAIDDHPLSISLVAPHLKTLTPAQIREELRKGLERFADASAEEGRNRSLMAGG